MKTTLLLILLLCGACETSQFPNSQQLFVVNEIRKGENQNGFCIYRASPFNEGTLNVRETWVADSIGAFQIGDTIYFARKSTK